MQLLSTFDVASALIGGTVALVLVLAIFWPWIERQRAQDARPGGGLILEVHRGPGPQPAATTTAAPARKMALVIRRGEAPLVVRVATQPYLAEIPDGWAPRTFMADRAVCETDESTLQLLPYVVVTDGAGRVLTYRRGRAGGEGRLHDLRSVGLGGHVDTAPNAYFEGPSLMPHLREEACRELAEEARLTPMPWELVERGLIVDPTNPVGRVHLGILMTYQAHPEEVAQMAYEAGAVDDARWMTLDELAGPDELGRLEPWSKIAVGYLQAAMQAEILRESGT